MVYNYDILVDKNELKNSLVYIYQEDIIIYHVTISFNKAAYKSCCYMSSQNVL